MNIISYIDVDVLTPCLKYGNASLDRESVNSWKILWCFDVLLVCKNDTIDVVLDKQRWIC